MLRDLQHWQRGAMFAPEFNTYPTPSRARVMLAGSFIDGATRIGDCRLSYSRSVFLPAKNLDFIVVQICSAALGAW